CPVEDLKGLPPGGRGRCRDPGPSPADPRTAAPRRPLMMPTRLPTPPGGGPDAPKSRSPDRPQASNVSCVISFTNIRFAQGRERTQFRNSEMEKTCVLRVFIFRAHGGRGAGPVVFIAAAWLHAPRIVLFRSRSFTLREKGNEPNAEVRNK